MRREYTFSAAGFLAGFILATVIFFQHTPEPAAAGAKPEEPAAGNTSSSAPPSHEPGRIGRPIVIHEEEVDATKAETGAAAKSPATLLHETIASLPGLDERDRDRAVNELVEALRQHGPAGLQAVREFFKTAQDVKIRNGWGMSNGRITSAPSLRIALLDALREWPGGTELNLEILRETSRAFEASLAVRNLEKSSPGVYRAEAIRTMSTLAAQPMKGEFAAEGMNYVFDAMRHFNAPELLPAAEKLVASQPWAAFQLMNALKEMAPEVRGPAYGRLFSDPKIAAQLASNPHTMQNLNYADPHVAQHAAHLYATLMDAKQRDRFLGDFGSNRAFSIRSDFFAPEATANYVTVAGGTEVPELQARLGFLDQIAPHSTTPVLQQRLAEAREDINKAIANPRTDAVIGGDRVFQIGTGAGEMKIRADTIRSIEIRQK
jgi:hypothetical protein